MSIASPPATAARTLAILGAIIAAAAALRFHRIGSQPFWIDEMHAYWFSSHALREVWIKTATLDAHPPLYFSLLKLWSIFGRDEAGLRSLSALFGTATVPLVFWLGRTVGGRADGAWVGLLAAVMFAAWPLHLQYGQEARPYAALTFAITLTLCALAELMRSRADGVRPGSAIWLALLIGASLSLWFHNVATVFLAGLAAIVVLWLGLARGWDRQTARPLGLVAVLVGAIYLPHLSALLAQADSISAEFWIPRPTADHVAMSLSNILGISFLWLPWPIGSLVAVSLGVLLGLWIAGLRALARRGEAWLALLLAGAVVLPVVLEIVVSYAVRPIFVARTLIWISIPFAVVVAVALAVPRWRWFRPLAAIGIVLALLKADYGYHASYAKEPWDRIAATVAEAAGPDVPVLVMPSDVALALGRYLRPLRKDVTLRGLPDDFPAVGFANPYPAGSRAVPAFTASDVAGVNALLARHDAAILVTRSTHIFDPENRALAALTAWRPLAHTYSFHDGIINVYVFKDR
ncbi:MAG: hypothetical protein FJX57_18970 [Alphaproteobacteria bacterium]|nr:hypothetical protein [Alphaproteobacteria bacterium]